MSGFPLPRPEGYVPTEQDSNDIKAAFDNADEESMAALADAYPLEWDEWLESMELGTCDRCNELHNVGDQTDHCRECGNCWLHCSCTPKRTIESNEEEDVAAGLIPPLDA